MRFFLLPAAFCAGLWANMAQAAALRLFLSGFLGTEIYLSLYLALWLAGVSIGAAASGAKGVSLSIVLCYMAAAPILTFIGIGSWIFVMPDVGGEFLPALPIAVFLALLVLPLSLAAGGVLPALLNGFGIKLGVVYAAESLGGFAGGVLTSLMLGGKSSPIVTLVALPILPLSILAAFMSKYASGGGKAKRMICFAILLILWPTTVSVFSATIVRKYEDAFWNRFHKGYKLVESFETPYQKIQIGEYEGQRSLFCNGAFSGAWPDRPQAELRVHTFMTTLPEPKEILIVGVPTPDMIVEFLKYTGLKLTIVDLDALLLDKMLENLEDAAGLSIAVQDPRSYMRLQKARFDGILMLSNNPTTLSANRLFTKEAFVDAASALTASGVLSVSVMGAENYLGSELEKTVLSTHRALLAAFRDVFAVPGDSITFWAARSAGVLATDPVVLGKRFSDRNIVTESFLSETFKQILQPFRVKELENWLRRNVEVPENTDLHPRAFIRQLLLWDIFSGAQMAGIIRTAEHLGTKAALCGLLILAVSFACLFLLLGPNLGKIGLLSLGTAISGGGGLLLEIVLMLMYQTRQGAMYQMSALFFGIYMLGLAVGAYFAESLGLAEASRLRILKAAQLLGVLIVYCALLPFSERHSATIIAAAIFFAAFLDGIEFPAVDAVFKKWGMKPERSGALLMFADNFGALWVGFAAGIWLLPAIGMAGSILLLSVALALNLAALCLVTFPDS